MSLSSSALAVKQWGGLCRGDRDLWLCWRCVARPTAALVPCDGSASPTACHPIGLGGVNERRAQWVGALSLPSKARDCFLFPAFSRTRRSGVVLISLCLSVPALPGLDLTIHLRRLCGISQRRRRVEDWRCFERSSR